MRTCNAGSSSCRAVHKLGAPVKPILTSGAHIAAYDMLEVVFVGVMLGVLVGLAGYPLAVRSILKSCASTV